jgi:transcriptional regulator with XRE-family HTH domain
MKPEELITQIGKKIRDIRKEKNIDQNYIAKQLNVTQSHISHIENGHQDPGVLGLFSVSQVLQTSFLDFLPPELKATTNINFNDNSIQNNQGHVHAQGSISINLSIPKTKEELAAVMDIISKAGELQK